MKKALTALLLLFSISCFSQFETKDAIYTPDIKTVLLYPFSGSLTAPARTLTPPIRQLNDNQPLILEFDDLSAEYSQYHVKIKHCTADWEISILNEIEFMEDFNDFIINDYEVSQNTKVPYFHYTFKVPEVRISGNYLLVLSKDSDRGEPILTKRFMVYESFASAIAEIRIPQDSEFWRTHQQVDFEVTYGNYGVRSAKEEFRIFIRQNYQWSQMIKDLRPMTDNASTRKLFFRFFNNENIMLAGNEFNFFDGRSTYTRGLGIAEVEQGSTDTFWLNTQQKGSKVNFVEQRDYNGQFVIENRENQNPSFSNDYVWVNFSVASPLLLDKEVYVVGEFDQWQLNEDNLLKYDRQEQIYETRKLMKLGVYDYRFVVKDIITNQIDYTYFSGNFTDTENVYEIFIYHKPPTARAEKLIGYQVVNSRGFQNRD
jgi:hypothetical protein